MGRNKNSNSQTSWQTTDDEAPPTIPAEAAQQFEAEISHFSDSLSDEERQVGDDKPTLKAYVQSTNIRENPSAGLRAYETAILENVGF
ncbi:hypothetical protein N7478_011846 [Penicillium angulare]|uniref:uncharacterized protein n=1 Tax=Penicillium angulare TaxID=116970 RepID=UPI00254252F9|nr:uncharacterized protein N7478_011846 [Penicillium angulare]KAJ5261251.1 hypothetical protein N7478_011846 [Penicillium angulare]